MKTNKIIFLSSLLFLSGFVVGQAKAADLASGSCPAGALVALQTQAFAEKLIPESKVEYVYCERSTSVLSGRESFVVLHQLQRSNGDMSVVLSLYKSENFSLASEPIMVRRELTSDLFPFKLNGQRRLLAVQDVDGDKKDEILFNASLGGDVTGVMIFSADAASSQFKQRQLRVLGPISVREDRADFIKNFAGSEIELNVSAARPGLTATLGQPRTYSKMAIVKASVQFLEESGIKK